jgi:predicted nucleic acid-binding protein
MLTGGPGQFAVAAFETAHWLQKNTAPVNNIAAVLLNSLDSGEAAMIQLALNENIQTVCLDEIVGRRMARLHGLTVTGSIGVLLRARYMALGKLRYEKRISFMLHSLVKSLKLQS